MKTFIYFIFTIFISCGSLLAALNAKNPFPYFAVGFGIWVPFLWGWNKRMKKAEEKRRRERLFDEYLEMQVRKNRKY